MSLFLSDVAAKAESANSRLPREVTFESLYRQILDSDLDIKSSELNIETARARRTKQLGAFTPSVALESSHVRSGEPFANPRQSGDIAASMNLFSSGADYAGLKASLRDIDASRELRLSQIQKAEQSALEVLISEMASARRLQINEKIVELRSESLRIAKERYAKGILPQQEVDKISIDLENSRAKLIDAKSEEASAQADLLSRLGGQDGTRSPETLRLQAEWPWRNAISSESRLESEPFQIEQLPDYRAALKTLEAEGFRRHQARSAFLPSLDLTGSYGSADVSQPGLRDWAATLTLTIPLFEQLKGWSATSLQVLAQESAELNRRKIARRAPAEVESLRQRFHAARDSALARERQANRLIPR